MHTVLLLKTSGIAGSLSWVSYLRATTQHPRNNQDCEPGYTVVHYTGLKEKMRCPFLCHLQRCYKSEQCSIYVNYIIFFCNYEIHVRDQETKKEQERASSLHTALLRVPLLQRHYTLRQHNSGSNAPDPIPEKPLSSQTIFCYLIFKCIFFCL